MLGGIMEKGPLATPPVCTPGERGPVRQSTAVLEAERPKGGWVRLTKRTNQGGLLKHDDAGSYSSHDAVDGRGAGRAIQDRRYPQFQSAGEAMGTADFPPGVSHARPRGRRPRRDAGDLSARVQSPVGLQGRREVFVLALQNRIEPLPRLDAERAASSARRR